VLAHFFEEEGIPTTQISLIRKHTETISPPRALWVPFELGRPFGAPGDSIFQTEVLQAALKLLEAPGGPVIEDFPAEAPVSEAQNHIFACPVDLSVEKIDDNNVTGLRETLNNEMIRLRPWYDLAVKNRGRTTVGVSGVDLDLLGDFVSEIIYGDIPENKHKDLPFGYTLKLAIDDLKAYYNEAFTAQPGGVLPESRVLDDWFWDQTIAAKVLFAIKDLCAKSDDAGLRLVGNLLIVPMAKDKNST